MKSGWLIYTRHDAKRNASFITWMKEEASSQDLTLSLIYREDLSIGVQNHTLTCLLKGKRAPLPDFAIIRTMDPLLTAHLEQLDVATFNSSEVSRICNDKAKTHQKLARHGIPMVDTFFLKGSHFTASTSPLPYPYILKRADSRGGKDVWWIEDEEQALDAIDHLQHHTVIIQRPAPVLGKDLRVFVVGSTIVGAILREKENDFKANYSLGGRASVYSLSSTEMERIQQIIQLFSFGMVGIDFLFDEEGSLLLNEIEDVVGSRTLSEKSSVNIVRTYLTYIKEQLKTPPSLS